MTFSYIVSIFFLIFGFGFVIFWHELGHFLAAKKSGIRVEQFAVGMGHAIFSWRKGIGFRTGNTQKEYEKRAIEQWEKTRPADADGLEKQDPSPAELATAATEAGLGDTEYRLNWIPIGGYVKMLGQDDMDATSVSDDPRSYNRKSIGARMFVVSAGVIMNVILAAIGFMILFLVGFNVSPSVVGHITPGSPAWQAGFQVGDRIVSIDGNDVEPNFTKVVLNSALLRDGDDVPVKIKRNGQPMDLRITPRRPGAKQLVALGIGGPVDLSVPEGLISSDDDKQLVPQDRLALNAGDTIVSVNGKPVEAWTRGKDPKADKEVDAGNSPKNDYAILDEAIQKSFGEPVNIDVVDAKTKKPRTVQVHPRLDERFGEQQIGFAGMIPRASVHSVDAKSPAKGKLLPNDVVFGISFAGSNDKYTNVSERRLRELLATAGTKGQKVTFTVLRDGKEVVVPDLATDFKIDQGTGSSRGLGIGLAVDADHLIVADLIKDGPAEVAKIPLGAEILSVGGKPVKSWNDVYHQLSTAKAGEPIDVSFKTQNTDEKPVKMSLSAAQLDEVKSTGYTHDLPLAAWIVPQKTSSPLIAAKWGVLETRDFIFQFYVTLRRFADGTVSPTNAMGPVGIISAGTSVASRGNDWMLWFLCMISANLAVVNFLPIPVVDGGLFMFLVLEKIKGKPLSPRAQQVAQVTGLILLASVFLFVTYNDITRHL